MAKVALAPLPFEAAIESLRRRGLNPRPTHSYRDLWNRAHATAFTVAKSAGFDILGDVHQALEKILKGGGTFDDFLRDLKPLLIAKGWWGRAPVEDPLTGQVAVAQLGSPRRLKTIFDVNLRVAHAAGHHSLIERTKRSRPYLRYVAVLDDRTREDHARWHGVILPVDHPWWETHYPPNGWNCRCTVQSLSAADIEREGWKVTETPPRDTLRSFVNDRTGERQEVPDGIDPAFAYNPGEAGADAMAQRAAKVMADKTVAAPPRFAAQVAAGLPGEADAARAEEFTRWLDGVDPRKPKGERRVVGALPAEVLDHYEALGQRPASGAVVVTDQRIAHLLRDSKAAAGKGLSIDEVARLPEVLARPRAILRQRSNGRLVYVFEPRGRDARQGKLVVHVDYVEKGATGNQVISGGLVPLEALTDVNAYELISGAL